MKTKRFARWIIVLFLLAALPGLTAVMAQGGEPAGMEVGAPAVVIPWQSTESEPNNSSANADDTCEDNGICRGINAGKIDSANDVDYWAVYVDDTLQYGDYWHTRTHYPFLIDIEAASIGSPLNASICLYSDDGFELACNQDTDGSDPMLYYNLETNNDIGRRYYLAVRAQNGQGAGPNGKYQLLTSTPYLISAAAAGLGTGNVQGIPFQAGDVLAWSQYGYYPTQYEKWVMLIDFSDLAPKGNISNLSGGWRNSDFLLVGFASNTTVPGIGRPVTPWEVVVFNPTTVGPRTEGTFSLWWDGRQKGLTVAGEKLDAIDWPDWNGYTRLFASTVGTASVYQGPGRALKQADEDIGLWSDGPAAQSYPKWARSYDSSRVAGVGVGDVVAFSYLDESIEDAWWGDWFVVLQGATNGFTQKDIGSLGYRPGDTLQYDDPAINLVWRGPDHGWNYNIDAIQVQWSANYP